MGECLQSRVDVAGIDHAPVDSSIGLNLEYVVESSEQEDRRLDVAQREMCLTRNERSSGIDRREDFHTK